jgi:MFS transporter, DHA1 family, multidrug resistance protein
MFAAQLLSAVGFSTIFPFLPNYVEHLGSARGAPLLLMVTLVFSVQAVAMAVASPIWGALSDRWGRKPMVERALYGGAVLILLMGFARSSEELVLLRLLQGLVTGVVSAGTTLVASVAPRERLGYAMGVMQTGLWAGVSVGPVIGGFLEYLFGFRVAFVLTAVLLFAGGILVSTLVRERFVRSEDQRGGVGGLASSFGTVLRAPGVAVVLLVRFTAWLGRTMIVPFLPLYVAGLMAGAETAGIVTGLAIGVASAAGTATSILLGRLGDRIGHRTVLVFGALATAAAYVPIAFVTEAWQLVALYGLTGATIGGVLPSISALLGAADRPRRGRQRLRHRQRDRLRRPRRVAGDRRRRRGADGDRARARRAGLRGGVHGGRRAVRPHRRARRLARPAGAAGPPRAPADRRRQRRAVT